MKSERHCDLQKLTETLPRHGKEPADYLPGQENALVSETLKEIEMRDRLRASLAIDKIIDTLKTEGKQPQQIDEDKRDDMITDFQDKHIPDYLHEKKERGSSLNKLLDLVFARHSEILGIERIPKEGPFLVISNHFGKDANYLLALLKDYDTHIATSKTLFWKHSPISRWFMKRIRALAAPESLEHLSEDEKTLLLGRIPKGLLKNLYTEIVERERNGDKEITAKRIAFIKNATALLSRGDVIIIFPEGLWLYDGENETPRAQSMYQGYGGIDTICKQYEKLTGKELSIIPIAIYSRDKESKRTLDIGNPLTLSQNQTLLSNTDWCMTHIAKKLPAEQRGYYTDMTEQLSETGN
jgi:molybdopterin converting factor small subunit